MCYPSVHSSRSTARQRDEVRQPFWSGGTRKSTFWFWPHSIFSEVVSTLRPASRCIGYLLQVAATMVICVLSFVSGCTTFSPWEAARTSNGFLGGHDDDSSRADRRQGFQLACHDVMAAAIRFHRPDPLVDRLHGEFVIGGMTRRC